MLLILIAETTTTSATGKRKSVLFPVTSFLVEVSSERRQQRRVNVIENGNNERIR